jgi:hypothetical protein
MAYTFNDVINPADPTFNQELGINNSDVIAGYNGQRRSGPSQPGLYGHLYCRYPTEIHIHFGEFSWIGADPGRRHQQQPGNGRFLFPHQQWV